MKEGPMFRSRKKIPMHSFCGAKRKHYCICKRKMVHKTRRWLNQTDDISDGNQFKKAEFTWRTMMVLFMIPNESRAIANRHLA